MAKLGQDHHRWSREWANSVRNFILSPPFQSAVQFSVGTFLAGLFVFIRPISFPLACLAALLVVVVVAVLSPDNHVGTRLTGAATLLGAMTWGLVLGGAVLTLAHAAVRPYCSSAVGCSSHTALLCCLSVVLLAVLGVNRAALGPPYPAHVWVAGMVSVLAFGLVLIAGQFVTDVRLLWTNVVGGLLLSCLVAAGFAAAVSLLVLPSLASDEMRADVAAAIRGLGHAASRFASRGLQQEPHGPLLASMLPPAAAIPSAAAAASLPPASPRSRLPSRARATSTLVPWESADSAAASDAISTAPVAAAFNAAEDRGGAGGSDAGGSDGHCSGYNFGGNGNGDNGGGDRAGSSRPPSAPTSDDERPAWPLHSLPRPRGSRTYGSRRAAADGVGVGDFEHVMEDEDAFLRLLQEATAPTAAPYYATCGRGRRRRAPPLPVVAPPGGILPSPSVRDLMGLGGAASVTMVSSTPAGIMPYMVGASGGDGAKVPQGSAKPKGMNHGSAAVAGGHYLEEEKTTAAAAAGPPGSGAATAHGGGGVGSLTVAWAPVSALRPLLARARACAAVAVVEPPWMVRGPSHLASWTRVLSASEVLLGRLSSLECLLEDHKPGQSGHSLGDVRLAADLGVDVVSPYRQVYGEVAASCAAMSVAVAACLEGRHHSSASSSSSSFLSLSRLRKGRGNEEEEEKKGNAAAAASAAATPATDRPSSAGQAIFAAVGGWQLTKERLRSLIRTAMSNYWSRVRSAAHNHPHLHPHLHHHHHHHLYHRNEEGPMPFHHHNYHHNHHMEQEGETQDLNRHLHSQAHREERNHPHPHYQQQRGAFDFPHHLHHSHLHHHHSLRAAKIRTVSLHQARAMTFLWTVTEGVISAMDELESAVSQALTEPRNHAQRVAASSAASGAPVAAAVHSLAAAALPPPTTTTVLPLPPPQPTPSSSEGGTVAKAAAAADGRASETESSSHSGTGDGSRAYISGSSGSSGCEYGGGKGGGDGAVSGAEPQAPQAAAPAIGVAVEGSGGGGDGFVVLQIDDVMTAATADVQQQQQQQQQGEVQGWMAKWRRWRCPGGGGDGGGSSSGCGTVCASRENWCRCDWSKPLAEITLGLPMLHYGAVLLVSHFRTLILSGPAARRALLRQRLFQYSIKYWLVSAGSLVFMLAVASQPGSGLMRHYPMLYAYIATAVSMTDRVESTLSRSALRVGGTLLGGVLGLWVMLLHPWAHSPVGLLAVVTLVAFLTGCLASHRLLYGMYLTVGTLLSIVFCQYGTTPYCCTTPGSTLEMFAARVVSVLLGCTLPVLFSQAVLPWYTSDWALEIMAAAFVNSMKIVRQLYEKFFDEHLRAHVASWGAPATAALLRLHGMDEQAEAVLRDGDKTTATAAAVAAAVARQDGTSVLPGASCSSSSSSSGGGADGAAEEAGRKEREHAARVPPPPGAQPATTGTAVVAPPPPPAPTPAPHSGDSTTSTALRTLVSGPLVAVQTSLMKDTAVWSRGIYAVPQIVPAVLRCGLLLTDRLAALQLVVADTPPPVYGRLSGWAFERMVLPLHREMMAVLAALDRVSSATAVLLDPSGAAAAAAEEEEKGMGRNGGGDRRCSGGVGVGKSAAMSAGGSPPPPPPQQQRQWRKSPQDDRLGVAKEADAGSSSKRSRSRGRSRGLRKKGGADGNEANEVAGSASSRGEEPAPAPAAAAAEGRSCGGDEEGDEEARDSSAAAEVQAAVQDLDLCRLQIRQHIHDMRRAFHADVRSLDEQYISYGTHPDDTVHVNSMLYALVKVLDKATALARTALDQYRGGSGRGAGAIRGGGRNGVRGGGRWGRLFTRG